MPRNYGLDFIKFCMAISIALWHSKFPKVIPTLNATMITIFFFILSGFFLVNSYESNKYRNTWHYTMSRVLRIYPYYFFAFVVLFITTNIIEKNGLHVIAAKFIRYIPELFIVQNVGIYSGGLNYPLWQFCALIVVSHILFSMLTWNKQLTLNTICPILTLACFTYLSNLYGTGELDIWGNIGEFIHIPLLRAAGAVSFGMFLNYPIRKTLSVLEQFPSRFINALLTGTVVVSCILLYITRENYTGLIIFPVIILCVQHPGCMFYRMFESRYFSFLDKISLSIYFNHAVVILILKNAAWYEVLTRNVPAEILYLVILLVYAFLAQRFVEMIILFFNRLIKKHRRASKPCPDSNRIH